MKIFLLLYADDTVILAESEVELQKVMDSLFEFCRYNKSQINTSKSTIMVFSRWKIRKEKTINFGVILLKVVDDYIYLGIVFNYNGKFNKAIHANKPCSLYYLEEHSFALILIPKCAFFIPSLHHCTHYRLK